MKFIGIIPARYGSTRFPGKPLVEIGGKSMIERVCIQASQSLPETVVATDDERIYDHVRSKGFQALMTSADHPSGTDRCAEALELAEESSGSKYDVVINIQGDEPFIQPGQIDLLKDCFTDPSVEIATLARKALTEEEINDPNLPKVVADGKMDALIFSRSPVPYLRTAEPGSWSRQAAHLIHVGMYGYRSDVLREITTYKPSWLESAESLEQLRWLENGKKIRIAITGEVSVSIDTPEDLERVNERFL